MIENKDNLKIISSDDVRKILKEVLIPLLYNIDPTLSLNDILEDFSTKLQTIEDGTVSSNTSIIAGKGLTGGGKLNSDITLNVVSNSNKLLVTDDGMKILPATVTEIGATKPAFDMSIDGTGNISIHDYKKNQHSETIFTINATSGVLIDTKINLIQNDRVFVQLNGYDDIHNKGFDLNLNISFIGSLNTIYCTGYSAFNTGDIKVLRSRTDNRLYIWVNLNTNSILNANINSYTPTLNAIPTLQLLTYPTINIAETINVILNQATHIKQFIDIGSIGLVAPVTVEAIIKALPPYSEILLKELGDGLNITNTPTNKPGLLYINKYNDNYYTVINFVTSLTNEYYNTQYNATNDIIDTWRKSAFDSRQIIAGNGLSGTGTLDSDITLNISSVTDGLIINNDDILLDTQNNITSTSITKPLSANMGKYLYDTKLNLSGGKMTGSLELPLVLVNKGNTTEHQIMIKYNSIVNDLIYLYSNSASQGIFSAMSIGDLSLIARNKTTGAVTYAGGSFNSAISTTTFNSSSQVIAGNGLTGGGNLLNNVTLHVATANDGIIVNPDNIQLDTQNNLTSASITKPLSAAQGKYLYDNKANNALVITAGSGLTGGGDLSASRTLNIVSANSGIVINADNIELKPGTSSAIGGVKPDGTTITVDAVGKITTAEKWKSKNNYIPTGLDANDIFENGEFQLTLASQTTPPDIAIGSQFFLTCRMTKEANSGYGIQIAYSYSNFYKQIVAYRTHQGGDTPSWNQWRYVVDSTKNIIAGNGLIGGGTLIDDIALNIVSTNDGIIVNADNIQLDTQNNLTSASITKPLSAAQGKYLYDNKANNALVITAGSGLTGGGDLSASRTLNIVSANDGIIVNADNIQLDTQNVLTSTAVNKPLSANMGKVLQDTKLNLTGGTLTGDLNGTSAFFSGNVTSQNIDTNASIGHIVHSGNYAYIDCKIKESDSSGNYFRMSSDHNYNLLEYYGSGGLSGTSKQFIRHNKSTGVVTYAGGNHGTINGSTATFSGAVTAPNLAYNTTQIIAGTGLVGGGDLSASRTLNIVSANSGIVINADNIELKPGTSSAIGGVKPGYDMSIDSSGLLKTLLGQQKSFLKIGANITTREVIIDTKLPAGTVLDIGISIKLLLSQNINVYRELYLQVKNRPVSSTEFFARNAEVKTKYFTEQPTCLYFVENNTIKIYLSLPSECVGIAMIADMEIPYCSVSNIVSSNITAVNGVMPTNPQYSLSIPCLNYDASTSTQIIAGTGLVGGGDLTTSRTLNITSANAGIVVNSDNIELKPATTSIIGGVKPDGTTTSVDVNGVISTVNRASTATQIIAGLGLTGGGDISTSRTLNIVSANDGIIANADNIQLDTQNVLTSTAVNKPLSANMGKVLQDTKLNLTGGTLTGDLNGTSAYYFVDSFASRIFATSNVASQIGAFKGDKNIVSDGIYLDNQGTKQSITSNLPIGGATLIQRDKTTGEVTYSGGNYGTINGTTATFSGNVTAPNLAYNTTQIIAGTGLTGGGDLTTDRTLNITSANAGIVVNSDNIELKPATTSIIGGVKPDGTTTSVDVNGVISTVNRASTATQIIAGSGLTGGGDISASRTLNIASANDGIIVNPDNIQLDTQNNLTSTSITKPLSAAQGKYLQDNKINLSGGSFTGDVNNSFKFAAPYFNTNGTGIGGGLGTKNGFYAFGNATTSVSYGLNIISPNAGTDWGLNLFGPLQTSRFIYFSKLNKVPDDSSTAFTVMSKIALDTGNYTTTGTYSGTDFLITSDRRLKKNIKKVKNITSDLSKINIYNYRLKKDNTIQTGLIAQDIKKHFPDFVSTMEYENKEYLNISYGRLGAVAGVNANKEIVSLKKEIKILKNDINTLKKLIKSITQDK